MIRIEIPKVQRGAVMFMALIFLVLLTVMAVTTFTISKGTSQVVGNLASRKQTLQTAAQVSDMAISTYRIVNNPAAVLSNGGVYSNSLDVDINGDGKTVINAQIPAAGQSNCFQATLKQVINMDPNDPVQKGCINSAGSNVACFDVSFRFTVNATDPVTNATSSVTQGASVVADSGAARNICHGPAPDYVTYF